MKYQVHWDNGGDACGTFPEKYDKPEHARQAGENWESDMGEGYVSEVVECEPDDDDEPKETWFDPKADGWVGHDGRP